MVSRYALCAWGFGALGALANANQSDESERAPIETPTLNSMIASHLEAIQSTCHDRNGVVEVTSLRILCITGSISRDTHPEIGARVYDAAYVDTPGGSIIDTIELGLEIHRNYAFLIVDQRCYSACGAYLVPASRRLFMMDGAMISFHGSLPRSSTSYIASKFASRGLSPETASMGELLAYSLEELESFKKFADEELSKEFEYFLEIEVHEAYVTRYLEMKRRLRRKENYNCGRMEKLSQVVGPEYLREFNIRTAREWFPEDLAFYVERNPNSSWALIFDFQEDPFYVPEMGLVTREACEAG